MIGYTEYYELNDYTMLDYIKHYENLNASIYCK